MVMIKCSECGNKVSDKTKVCMNCGCSVESTAPDGFRIKMINLMKKLSIVSLLSFLSSLMFMNSVSADYFDNYLHQYYGGPEPSSGIDIGVIIGIIMIVILGIVCCANSKD